MNMPQPNRFDRTRRQFFQAAGVLSAATLVPRIPPTDAFMDDSSSCNASLPAAFSGLKPLGEHVRPIAPDECRQRIERAQQLMAGAPLAPSGSPSQAVKYDALFVAPGTSLYYFTGIRWGISERLLALVLPRTGDPIVIVPGFEEGRLREKLQFPAEVRVWQEDESPTKIAVTALGDRGIRTGRVGVEETAAFTFFDHLRGVAPGFECV